MRLSALACTSCLLTLAACTPPALPAAQSAKGTKEASITLPAQPRALRARLQATSRALVDKDFGWVELRIFAGDADCTRDQVVRQPPMGPHFSVTLNCEASVEAGKPMVFRAEQVDRDAQTQAVEIQATYER
jgi:hypothetical protein